MNLSIYFIGNNTLLAVCNMFIQTEEPEKVKLAFIEELAAAKLEGTAADLMTAATEKVMMQCKDMVLIDVNDDQRLAHPENSIQVRLS